MIGSCKRGTSELTSISCRWIAAWLLIIPGFCCAAFAQESTAGRPAAVRTPLPSPGRPSEMLGRSLSLSAVILATGGVVLLLGRRFQAKGLRLAQGSAPAHLAHKPRITSRVRLTNRQMVHVMQLGDRVLVLGTGSQDAPVLLAQWNALDDPIGTEFDENDTQPIDEDGSQLIKNQRVAPNSPADCTAPTAVTPDWKDAAA